MAKSQEIKAILANEAFLEAAADYRRALTNRAIARTAPSDEDRLRHIAQLHGFEGFLNALKSTTQKASE